jgi:hypothetical protein
MQTGSDQHIRKDFTFYDSMATAVLGVGTIAIYEVLRRNVWRRGSFGGRQLRTAIKTGVLAASVTLAKIALCTGISVRQVRRHLNQLRDLGWIKDMTEVGDGHALVFEMGMIDSQGVERYSADQDISGLWGQIEEASKVSGWDRPLDILCAERLEIASRWFDRDPMRVSVLPPRPNRPETPDTLAGEGGQAGRGGRTDRPPEYRTQNIEKDIDKSEDITPRTHVRDENECSRPRGEGQVQDQEQTRKKEERGVDQEQTRKKEERGVDEEKDPVEFAIDSDPLPVQSGPRTTEERVAVAERAAEVAIERTLRTRAENEVKARGKEALAKNLKGRPVEVRIGKDLQRLWTVWSDLISSVSAPPVPWLGPDGDKIGRDQATKLLKMYGCDRTVQAASYVVGNWEVIGKRFFKQVLGVPTMSMLLRFHEVLFREAHLWEQHRGVMEAWEAWWKANPTASYAPDGLREQYSKAQTELSALGLGT